MRWLQQYFFLASDGWSKKHTLKSRTWKKLLDNAPGLKIIQKERRKVQRKRSRNSFLGAFITITLICLALISLCFITADRVDAYFQFLQWFNFGEKDKAYATISEVMGSTATVIGLSFVVIGFLFDVVKDKTQRTLEELFRATGLYQVFSISVISLVAIVIINCFKYTVSNYIACNFAVLSSLFLIIDVLAIAYLFYQLLLFFNPERLAQIASQQILDLAKFRLLDDRFNKTSIEVYQDSMRAYGLEEKSRFSFFSAREKPQSVWFTLGNKKEVSLINVYFPFLKFIITRIMRRSQENGYIEMGCTSKLGANQGILSLSAELTIAPWERLILTTAYLTTKPLKDSDDFDLMKEQLQKRLLKSSSDGDEDGISQAFEDIEKLYHIYYQSNL